MRCWALGRDWYGSLRRRAAREAFAFRNVETDGPAAGWTGEAWDGGGELSGRGAGSCRTAMGAAAMPQYWEGVSERVQVRGLGSS